MVTLHTTFYFYYIVYYLINNNINGQSFHLYHTKYSLLSNPNDKNCIYHYTSTHNGKGQHLIPYCIRVDDNIKNFNECYQTSYTFKELRRMNINGNDLYSWFAPIDIINDYELFLTEDESNYTLNKYCNCSSTMSFGNACQYKFEIFSSINTTFTFEDVIYTTFNRKYKRSIHDLYINKDFTCYLLFNCKSNTDLCLDWRQICDGRFDCINGEDEKQCLEMEFNECDIENEYRCRIGMCIPKIFSFDLTMDCLDFYDEQEKKDNSHSCYWDSSADCDEHHCGRLESDSFSCGDGSCLYRWSPLKECNTHRRNIQLKHLFAYDEYLYDDLLKHEDCLRYVRCQLGIYCLFYQCYGDNKSEYCDKLSLLNNFYCRPRDWDMSSVRFFLPPTGIAYPFVRILYTEVFPSSNGMLTTIWLTICINTSIPCDMSPILGPHKTNDIELFFYKGFICYDDLKIFDRLNIPKTIVEDIKILVAHCTFPIKSNHLLPNAFRNSSFINRHHLGMSYHRIEELPANCNSTWPNGIPINSELCSKVKIDRFICSNNAAIPRRLVTDQNRQCETDELFLVACINTIHCQFLREYDFSRHIPMVEFNEFCNGYSAFTDRNSNDTDETDCDDWPCSSHATRCDGAWNRPNGCDELNCPLSLPSAYIAQRIGKCSPNEHYCLQYNSDKIRCLPIEKANDGKIDCLFASDERWSYSTVHGVRKDGGNILDVGIAFRFQCTATNVRQYIVSSMICNCYKDCGRGAEDERLCPWLNDKTCSLFDANDYFMCKNGTRIEKTEQCDQKIDCINGEDEWTCDFDNIIFSYKSTPKYLSIETSSSPPRRKTIPSQNNPHVWFTCHRGILIRTEKNHTYCLCPPSFYGKQCQYQSERLTISFDSEILRSSIHLNSIYHLVFYLFNQNEQEIISFETFVYAPFVHSSIKHLIYLTYPRKYLFNSPHQRQFGNFLLNIDAYIITHTSVEHLLSWKYSIQFPFLPVNRLAFRLVFQEPRSVNALRCKQLGCRNGGICQKYINTDQLFCRCSSDWFGITCEKRLDCEKSKCFRHSKCLPLNNQTFCLCPLGRTGHNCLVKYESCSGISCQNNGTCVTGDIRTKEYICQCSKEYFGKHCEYKNAQILINISSTIGFIPILNIIMIDLLSNTSSFLMYRNSFFYRNIQSSNQHIQIIEENQQYLSTFIFAQILNNYNSLYGTYYLLNYTNKTNSLTNLTTLLTLDKRCYDVNEYLDKNIMKLSWLKRVKLYYKLIKNIQCFYDEYYMCFFDQYQLLECYHFNHGHSNCSSNYQYCQNNGQCIQRKQQHTGELSFACICPECFSGSFCQFDMNQFYWTIDSSLSQFILVDTNLSQQPIIILILFGFILILCIIGFISNLISFLIFIQQEGHQVGSGYYLLILSILSPITLFMFLFRFTYLLINQIILVQDEKLLSFGCSILDYLLSFSISICDWLTACVTCERLISVIKGIAFNRKQSIYYVKFIIPLLIIIFSLGYSYQLFSRHLITDPRNDARQWCVIKYQYQWIETYDIILKLINCTIPFLVNLISTIILFILYTSKKYHIHRKQNYSNIFIEQIRQHKYLIITPLIMIMFKLPLFLTQISFKCINLKWQLYLSIIVYIISYIPLTTTFVLFVYFSPLYSKIFRDKWSKCFRRCFKSGSE